jgi:Biotin-requiring enzyme
MNRLQHKILMIGLALFVVACLVPPWKVVYHFSRVQYSKQIGYAFLFSPHQDAYSAGASMEINVPVLVLELLCIIALTSLVVLSINLRLHKYLKEFLGLIKEVEITVPDIGDYTDVRIAAILVKHGDTVKKEQALITLETDKAAMDVPSPYAGKITGIIIRKGDKVREGLPIMFMDIKRSKK